MLFANCHNHSTFSDGVFTPEVIAKKAKELGHGAVVLTDHDTVRGTYRMNKAARKEGLLSLLGVEFTAVSFGGVGIHMVCFDFDPEHPEIKRLLERGAGKAYKENELRFRLGIERGTLREGITWQDVVDRFPQNDYLCNNQVFDLMVEKGIYKFEEYNEFVTKNFHWYVDTQKVKEIVNIQYPSVSEVIDAVKKAGGVPGVAHPKGQSKYANELMEMGVMGFETLHPHLGEADSKFFDEFCEANRLYKFGGTDHSSVLSGYLGRMPEADYPPESGGMTEKSFMQLYKRELG